MKILELTNYSAGGCGVFARVKEEARLLSREGYEVRIFSSNLEKGTNKVVPASDKIDDVKISRFPAKKLGGESFMRWNFEKEALAFKPDVIIAHAYRHPHTLQALKVGKKLGSRVFLVTHAPFVEGNTTRSLLSKLSVSFYDSPLGPSRKLRSFDKIIAITKWEYPYLRRLGISKDKIVYIPNGIPQEFFKQKKAKETEKILFLGRIAPIKNLETLILAMKFLENKKIKLELVGPAEEPYLAKLKQLVKGANLQSRVIFSGPIYDIKEKISKIDSAKVFVLPSKREAMPQALIEAMAREKVIIASSNPGTRDLITDGKNGHLFEVGNYKALASKIDFSLKDKGKSIVKEAKKSVEQFSWDKIIRKLDDLITS